MTDAGMFRFQQRLPYIANALELLTKPSEGSFLLVVVGGLALLQAQVRGAVEAVERVSH